MYDEAWEGILEGMANMLEPNSQTKTAEQPRKYKDVENEEEDVENEDDN